MQLCQGVGMRLLEKRKTMKGYGREGRVLCFKNGVENVLCNYTEELV